ncbi:MAG: hypothetical protein RLZ44_843 [Pseudomonadota bacterium]|jgi:CysZ protein
MTELIAAFLLPFNGIFLIFKPGLRRFALIPLLVNVVLYVGVAWLGFAYFDAFMARHLPQGGLWDYLQWLLWPLAVLAYLLIAFYSFTVVANLIGAPFNSLLAARVETMLTGAPPPEEPTDLWRTILPAVLGELGKILYFLLRAIPVLLLFLIPGLNALAPLLWVLLGLWFLALEYGDYPMGNHGLAPRLQRRTLAKKRLSALAFGAGATALMMIPVLNLAAMPALVAGATRFWVERLGPAHTAG